MNSKFCLYTYITLKHIPYFIFHIPEKETNITAMDSPLIMELKGNLETEM